MMYSMTIFASLLGSALGFATTPHMKMGIPCSTEVKVTVTVSDTWCQASHPHDFVDNLGGDGPINGPFTPNSDPPVKAGAHISPTVVYTHGGGTPAWGVNATQGVANIATTGNIAVFIDPVSQFHSHWKANPATSCGAVDPSEAQTSVDLVLNGQNTHVSAIHMLAPSPDWFTGIKNLDMCVDGYWLPTKTVHSVPYDAGVDGGTFFRTADVPVPLNVNKIAKITCDVAGGPFCNQANTAVEPVAKFVIVTSKM